MRSRTSRVRTGIWLGIGMLSGAALLIIFILGSRVGWFRTGSSEAAIVELIVIPRPSSTATAIPTSQPTLALTTTPEEPTPTLMEGQFAVGGLVEVAGTGGDPLRFRIAASLQSDIIFFGLEHEVFEVLEGPVEADGYTWWFLSTPYDEGKRGWAVSTYLKPINSP